MQGLAHIEEISTSYLRSDIRTLESLDGALNETLMNFLRSGSPERQFILEYIQNAVDAGARNVKIVLDYDSLKVLIYNDGNSFSYDDFEAFCKIAKSRKDPTKMLIGYIGIGAKSAFAIAKKLELHSGGYHAVFDEANIHILPNLKYIWMIIPHPKYECYRERCKFIDELQGFRTAFVIEKLIRGRETLDNIYRILLDPNYNYYLDSRTVLFIPISNIKITVCVLEKGIEKCLRSFSKVLEKELHSYVQSIRKTLIELEEFANNVRSVEEWLVISKYVDVPEDIRRDPLTAIFKRENVAKRVIAVAFRIEGWKLKPIKGVVKFSIFSYMPIREIESGFNYLIHADFLTDPGRGGIVENIRWNEWLAKEVVKLVTEDVLEEFKSDEMLKYQTLILLPHVPPTDPFIYRLHNEIASKINEKTIIPTYEGFKKIDEATLLPKFVYEVVDRNSLVTLSKDFYRIKSIAEKEVHEYSMYLLESLSGTAADKLWNQYIRRMYLSLREIIELSEFNTYKGIQEIYSYLWNYLKHAKYSVERMLRFMVEDTMERRIAMPYSGVERTLRNLIVLTMDENVKKLGDVYLIPASKLASYLAKRLNLDVFTAGSLLSQIIMKEDLVEHVIRLCESLGYCWIESRSLKTEYSADEQYLSSFVREKLFDVMKPVIENKLNLLENAIVEGNTLNVKSIMKELVEVYYRVFKDKLCSMLRNRVKVKILGEAWSFVNASETLLPESDWHSLRRTLDMIDSLLNKLGLEPSESYKNLRSMIKFIDLDFYQGIDKELLKQFMLCLGCEFGGHDQGFTEFKRKIGEVLSIEISRILLSKQGYFVPIGSAKSGWDIVAMHRSTSVIAKVEVKGTVEESYQSSIALRCDVEEFSKCREECERSQKCLIVVVENVAKKPSIKIVDICELPKDILKRYRVELPKDILGYAKSIKFEELY